MKKLTRILAGLSVLTVLMICMTVIPGLAGGGETRLINDLAGSVSTLSIEDEAERSWNEDIVSVAKNAWYEAHAGDSSETIIPDTAKAAEKIKILSP